MEFRLLGPFEVRDGDRVLPVRAPRHRTVLAALALAGGRPVSVQRLREALGGEVTATVIRVYVSDLRGILPGDLIETVPGSRGYRLKVEPRQVDVWRFRELAGSHEADARALEEALALWRGPALDDVESDQLHQAEALPLEELRLSARERLCEARVQLGEHREAVDDLKDLVAAHPLREHAYRLLMLALYRSGDSGGALTYYARLRRILAEELGADPSPELRRLHERILRQDPALGAEEVPAPAELPRDDRTFTGRDALLARLDELLDPAGPPLAIVLYGHAGVGKSTLAVHLGWRHRDRFPDGQLFEELPDQPDVGAVLARFLRSLGSPAGTIPASFADRLTAYRTLTAGRRLFVVLDNVSAEEQARALLPTGPGSAAVITSRSPLAGLAGAEPYELEVFTPDEARGLLDRLGGAARVAADERATAQLLDACGGLPIAVRVVGSRLASSRDGSTRALARRLRDDPLDELRAGDVAVRPLLDLGYEGLSDELRALLRRLAALSAPGFAGWVAEPLGGPAGGVEAIADRGLLQRLASDEAGQDRYRLHALTRMFARGLLTADEAAEPLNRLAAVALARVRAAVLPLTSEQFGPGDADEVVSMGTTDIRDSVEWLDAELAFLVALVSDVTADHAWRLAHALTPYLEARFRLDEWRTVNRRAQEVVTGDPFAEALILRDLGDLRRAERDLSAAVSAYQAALGHLVRHGGPQDRARVLLRLGLVHLEQGLLAAAESHLAQGRAEFRACGDRRGEAGCLRALGVVRHRLGDHEVALDCLREAFATARDLGDRYAQAACLHELVTVRLARGEADHARRHAEEEHDLADRRLRDPRLTGYALLSLARAGHVSGDPEAGRHAAEAAARLRELGDRSGHAWALAALAEITGGPYERELAHSIFVELGEAHGADLTRLNES